MVLVEALAGAVLGLVTLWLVLRPLTRPTELAPPIFEPVDPEETPKGIALAALKEIEFDRETGKLSDVDYEFLKTKYTAAALEALRGDAVGGDTIRGEMLRENAAQEARASRGASGAVEAPTGTAAPALTALCRICGPRPEPDAIFCSTCGRSLTRQVAA